MKTIGKRKALTLACVISELWMKRQPTECEVGDTVSEICELLGAEFNNAVIDFIELEDFPTDGLSRKED